MRQYFKCLLGTTILSFCFLTSILGADDKEKNSNAARMSISVKNGETVSEEFDTDFSYIELATVIQAPHKQDAIPLERESEKENLELEAILKRNQIILQRIKYLTTVMDEGRMNKIILTSKDKEILKRQIEELKKRYSLPSLFLKKI